MKDIQRRLGLTMILFAVMAQIPMSCGFLCQDSCGCGPSAPPQDLIIKSFQLFTLNQNGQAVNPQDTLPYLAVFKALQVKEFEIKILSELQSPAVGSFGMAYACSPSPTYSRDEISSIQVVNKKQLTLGNGSVLNPDENITSYFGMGYFYSGQIIPVNEFIGSGRSVSLEESFKLGFNQPPGKVIKLEFEVRVILKSGKVFLIENQVLHLR